MPKPVQKEERGFRYQKRSKEDLKERANMKGGNFDTIFKSKFKQWKPKDGKNRIRILPPTWNDAKHYGLDIFVNYSIGPDNQSYLSLSKHGKGDDPIAEARREAQKEGNKDFAKKLNPNQRILYWIIDRNDEEEGPLLWAAPFTFDKALSNLCIDEDTKEVIFIDDPLKGRDVRFYREGTGLGTTYDASKMKVLGETTIHEDEGIENDWLDFIGENPLPEVLNFYDYDHIAAAFGGQAGRDEDEDEDKPAPRGKAKPAEDDEAPPPRRRVKEPVDEDETPPPRARQRARSSEDDGPADEDAKPARRSASRQPAPDPDDDDDQADDVPPVRRSRVAVSEDDDSPPSTRRTKPSEEGSGTLRDRIARRRSQSSDDD